MLDFDLFMFNYKTLHKGLTQQHKWASLKELEAELLELSKKISFRDCSHTLSKQDKLRIAWIAEQIEAKVRLK